MKDPHGSGTVPVARQDNPPEPLVADCFPLVERMARQLHRRVPSSIDLESLVHSGVVGLLEALERYDPDRGVPFQVYARHRIYGEMIQCLRSLDWVSRSIRAWGRRVTAARRQLCERLGREATSEELAGELGLSLDAYHKINYQVGEQKCLSLDDPSCGASLVLDRNACWETGHPEDPLDQVERRDLVDKLKRAVAMLPERERLVVTQRHYQELKFREIGEELGVTEARTCQLYVQARRRLRRALGD